MKLQEINRRLATISPQYKARFIKAEDETVDDEIVVTFAGAPTRWTIQVGAGYVGINEYGEDTDGEAWSRDHGVYPDVAHAVRRLVALLAEESQRG
jgi:hypothetical protein